jgi:hypothetical protein
MSTELNTKDDIYLAMDIRARAAAFNFAVRLASASGLTVRWVQTETRPNVGEIEVINIKRVSIL